MSKLMETLMLLPNEQKSSTCWIAADPSEYYKTNQWSILEERPIKMKFEKWCKQWLNVTRILNTLKDDLRVQRPTTPNSPQQQPKQQKKKSEVGPRPNNNDSLNSATPKQNIPHNNLETPNFLIQRPQDLPPVTNGLPSLGPNFIVRPIALQQQEWKDECWKRRFIVRDFFNRPSSPPHHPQVGYHQ